MREERKLAWRLITWALIPIPAFFIQKTGMPFVDYLAGALCSLTSLVLIESQRSLSKYTPSFRKAFLRVAIGLMSLVPAILGGLYFLGVIAAMARHAADDLSKAPIHGHMLEDALVGACVALVLPRAAFNVFRSTQMEALMIGEPRKWAFHLLARRRFIARCDAECFFFEGSVLAMTIACSSTLYGLLSLIAQSLRR